MKNKVIWIVVSVLVIGGVIWLVISPTKPGKLDAFASCIKDSGATFYGAFWCPHCQNQKALFGSSAKLLPYVECSTPDGKSQLPICTDAGVTGYPTWEFFDGTRESGEVSLERLGEVTGCKLPENNG
ncbi:MAG: thioredoxin domain-containing protein [bacterium]|nr:thioredoxin domain-containing protein [bacterium]